MSILDDIAEKIGELLSDEESMRQLRELAAMFSGGEETDGENGEAPAGQDTSAGGIGIDPVMIMQLMSAASASDKNIDLLKALRPHLSDERQQKLDRAMKLLKLYNIFTAMRESGMLNDLEKLL